MARRRIAALALSGASVAGGTGAAIAAVTKDDHEKAEQAVLADAAKRLNVTPDKLRDALSAAQDAQIDQAVKDGDLTQKRADAILARTDEHIAALKSGKGLRFHRHLRGGMPPEPKLRPGGLLPGEAAPEQAPPEQFFG